MITELSASRALYMHSGFPHFPQVEIFPCFRISVGHTLLSLPSEKYLILLQFYDRLHISLSRTLGARFLFVVVVCCRCCCLFFFTHSSEWWLVWAEHWFSCVLHRSDKLIGWTVSVHEKRSKRKCIYHLKIAVFPTPRIFSLKLRKYLTLLSFKRYIVTLAISQLPFLNKRFGLIIELLISIQADVVMVAPDESQSRPLHLQLMTVCILKPFVGKRHQSHLVLRYQ